MVRKRSGISCGVLESRRRVRKASGSMRRVRCVEEIGSKRAEGGGQLGDSIKGSEEDVGGGERNAWVVKGRDEDEGLERNELG